MQITRRFGFFSAYTKHYEDGKQTERSSLFLRVFLNPQWVWKREAREQGLGDVSRLKTLYRYPATIEMASSSFRKGQKVNNQPTTKANA